VQVNLSPAAELSWVGGCGRCPGTHRPGRRRGDAEGHRSLPAAATSDEFLSQSPQNWEQEKNFVKFSTTSQAEPIFSHNAINGTNIYKI